jgi:hypothetical protein
MAFEVAAQGDVAELQTEAVLARKDESEDRTPRTLDGPALGEAVPELLQSLQIDLREQRANPCSRLVIQRVEALTPVGASQKCVEFRVLRRWIIVVVYIATEIETIAEQNDQVDCPLFRQSADCLKMNVERIWINEGDTQGIAWYELHDPIDDLVGVTKQEVGRLGLAERCQSVPRRIQPVLVNVNKNESVERFRCTCSDERRARVATNSPVWELHNTDPSPTEQVDVGKSGREPPASFHPPRRLLQVLAEKVQLLRGPHPRRFEAR